MKHRIAIAGCGWISRLKYLPILQQKLKNRANIVAICDLDDKSLKSVASTFGITKTYTELSQMITQEKPDAVVVCTPPGTHARLVTTALEAGTHVLVEKPMALTPEDCQKMIDTSITAEKRLGVMHNQIFNPAFDKTCSLVSQGTIGRFLGMRIFLMTSVHDMTKYQDHWAHKLPGGMAGETAPHAVYMSLAFLQNVRSVEVRVKKHLHQYPWSVGEDVRFDLIADNGFSSVTLVYGSDQTAAEVDIFGTEGYLKVDLQSRIVVKHNRPQMDQSISAMVVTRSVLASAYQTLKSFAGNGLRYAFSKELDGHYLGIQQFLDFLDGKSGFPATGDKGKEVQEVMGMIVDKMPGIQEVPSSPEGVGKKRA
jgi:predicted dehydrogenase